MYYLGAGAGGTDMILPLRAQNMLALAAPRSGSSSYRIIKVSAASIGALPCNPNLSQVVPESELRTRLLEPASQAYPLPRRARPALLSC